MKRKKYYDLIEMPLDELMGEADKIRRENRPLQLDLCAIVNAKSGICREDCRFCAQSCRHRTGVATYPLISGEKILEGAVKGARAGAKRVGIVTSGKAPSKDEVEIIAGAVKKFPDKGVLPCASLGEIEKNLLCILKSAGLKRYHHNIETSENFYPNIVTTHTYRDRIRTILAVKNSGMEICSGGIFGLGESWKDRIEMALALKEMEVDSVPINFLMPIPGTPMEKQPVITVNEALRIISIFRIILKHPAIKVAAGREEVMKDLAKMIFFAGADGMMVGGYLTVPGACQEQDEILIKETIALWKK
ncbi:MAG: biotin synthase BioB [Candidatus Omnitrophota bacterium]